MSVTALNMNSFLSLKTATMASPPARCPASCRTPVRALALPPGRFLQIAQQLRDAVADARGWLPLAQPAELFLESPLELEAREAALAGVQVALHFIAPVLGQFPIDELEELRQRPLAVDFVFGHDFPSFFARAA